MTSDGYQTHTTCPQCGQRLLMRHGVRLSPRLADIFDVIERRGEFGVYPETLLWLFYAGQSQRRAANTLKANIWKLNEALAETAVSVRRVDHFGPYRVVGS
jgi:hypothetical protein